MGPTTYPSHSASHDTRKWSECNPQSETLTFSTELGSVVTSINDVEAFVTRVGSATNCFK